MWICPKDRLTGQLGIFGFTAETTSRGGQLVPAPVDSALIGKTELSNTFPTDHQAPCRQQWLPAPGDGLNLNRTWKGPTAMIQPVSRWCCWLLSGQRAAPATLLLPTHLGCRGAKSTSPSILFCFKLPTQEVMEAWNRSLGPWHKSEFALSS